MLVKLSKVSVLWRALIASVWLFVLAAVLQGSPSKALDVAHRVLLPFACLASALLLRPVWASQGGWNWAGSLVAGSAGGLAALMLLSFDFAAAAYVVLLSLFVIYYGVREVTLGILKEPLASIVSGVMFSFNLNIMSGLYSRFSDEEFSILINTALVGVFWLILVAWVKAEGYPAWTSRMGFRVSPLAVLAVAVGVSVILAVAALDVYQQSFRGGGAAQAQAAERNPFVCTQALPAPPDAAHADPTFSGAEVFAELIRLVQSNPDKQAPEHGFLAVATAERAHAERFKQALLSEAADALFTGPYGSVKFDQHRAALRAYYFVLVRRQFPDLFSAAEMHQLHEWFHRINRSAHTLEWVDFLYSIPYARFPSAPYLNQEVGAGLLALLEHGNLAAPALTARNRAYLAAELKGWRAGFRVPDDAFIYQRDWITNAYFQHLYQPGHITNTLLSFRWVAVQLPPDVGFLSYNLPAQYRFSMAPVAYLGFRLTGDPHLLWLAARGLQRAAQERIPVFAQPGAEVRADGVGRRPDFGSCLIYSQIGLSSKADALFPDKAVLRSGWFEGSPFALMNLRFSGWHQYKATATIAHVQYHRPVLVDFIGDSTYAFLPRGRAQHRDKRIPREDLNGVSIEQVGLPRVLFALTGVGSPWAQDPPRLARVAEFRSTLQYDTVSVEMEWHGWTLRRRLTLHHVEPQITVVDQLTSSSTASRSALLSWHLLQDDLLAFSNESAQRATSFPLARGCGVLSVESSSAPLAVQTMPRENAWGKVLTVRYEFSANSTVTTSLRFNPAGCA